jgi:hypothetical protein
MSVVKLEECGDYFCHSWADHLEGTGNKNVLDLGC